MAKKANPAVELASRLVETIRTWHDDGHSPVILQDVLAREAGSADDKVIKAALRHKDFTGAVILASKKSRESPVALEDDRERLLESPRLLEFALRRLCTPEAPAHPLAKVARQVEKPLQADFLEVLERHRDAGTWPAGIGARTIKKATHLYLSSMLPPPAEEVALAQKLVARLREMRDTGGTYPRLLQDLLGEVAPDAAKKLIQQALASEEFASAAVLTWPRAMSAPVALREDRSRLAGSDLLLEAALSAVCVKKKVTATLDELKDLIAPELHEDFERAVAERLREHTLPATVGALSFADGVQLYLTARPPEPAPLLAARLLQELQARRETGSGYPCSLAELVETVQPDVDEEVLAAALKQKRLKSRVVLAFPEDPAAPIALAEDEEQLAADPALLESALAAARTDADQALPLAAVAKKVHKDLRSAFTAAVSEQVTDRTLPATVGVLRIKKKPHLFLLIDLHTVPPRPTPTRLEAPTPAAPAPAPAPVLDFAPAFEEAFRRLDALHGAHNFVSLVELRAALPLFDRAGFDAGLHALRGKQFTLSAAEGRHGLTRAELDAGIRERDGALLLFVSRRA
jgi:hypothetical protein